MGGDRCRVLQTFIIRTRPRGNQGLFGFHELEIEVHELTLSLVGETGEKTRQQERGGESHLCGLECTMRTSLHETPLLAFAGDRPARPQRLS